MPKSRPEALRAVRFLEINLPCGGVERQATAWCEVGAQEFVNAGLHPIVGGGREDSVHHAFDGPSRRELYEP